LRLKKEPVPIIRHRLKYVIKEIEMKPAKKVTLWLSRSLAIAAAILAVSLPAFAYEEDTHFNMTYVICRSVGFTPEEALIVAAVDQGMDDSSGTVANGGIGGIIPNVEEEWKWHALDGYGYTQGGSMKTSGVLARRDQFFQDALKENNFLNKLIRLGVFFHYQQDTWGHRHHYESNHLSRDNYTTYNTPVGHAYDFHQPDRPPFDPVAALMNLEDGIVYARRFLQEGLGRTPGSFLGNYSPQSGTQDTGWSGDGKYVHQISLAGAPANSARLFLLTLIRKQIDTYTSSIDPSFGGRYTANEADVNNVRLALEQVCRDFQAYRAAGIADPAINIPTTAQKVAAGYTNLTTAIVSGQLPLTSANTDGMLIGNQPNGAIYLVIDGKLRWIPNLPTYNNLFSRPNVGLPAVTQYPIGAQLTDGAYLANTPGDARIFFVVDGTKRWISSLSAMSRYGFTGAIRSLTPAQLSALPDGPPVNNTGYPVIGKDGARISTPDGTIYLVINQQLRWIPNIATYNNLFSGGSVASVPTVAGYLVGPALTDGAYLAKAGADPKIYLIVDGKKRWITSPAAMTNFGFDWNKIRSLSSAQIAAIPDGLNIP
jgi:hypothetical protein